MTKRAIIFIPGFAKRERLNARDQLVDALQHYTDGWKTDTGPAGNALSSEAVHLTATSRQDPDITAEIDVYEAYWGDLIPDWSHESPLARFRRGWALILYWMVGGLARAVVRRELPARTMLALSASGLILLLWYAVVIAMLVKAFADGEQQLPELVRALTDAIGITDWMQGMLEAAGHWPLTLFLVGLVSMGVFEGVANISAFTKAYLRDEPIGDSTIGIRAKARQRVLNVLDTAAAAGDGTGYDEIHVVAHSLGGAIAVDALAEYGQDLGRIRLFTWGSSLGALCQQEPLIEAEIRKFYTAETRIANWVDVVFRWDYLGSKVPVPQRADAGMFAPRRMPAIFPPTQEPALPRGEILGVWQVHDAYYRCEDAMLMLVAPVESLPQPVTGEEVRKGG